MLKYYIPTMDGVNIIFTESGMEPLGSIWVGNFTEFSNLNPNEITMANGFMRLATEEEIVARRTPSKYKEVLSEPDFVNKSSGIWRVFTDEEKAAVDTKEQEDIAAQEALLEEERIQTEINFQNSKTLALKTVENNFLLLCEALLGNKAKASFSDLNTALTSLLSIDQNQAFILSLKLLALDAEGKREGGLTWWDTCTWHEDIV